MVDSPREVIGAVLRTLGASYNTEDFEKEVPGGKEAVKNKFLAFQKQVLNIPLLAQGRHFVKDMRGRCTIFHSSNDS